MNRRWLLTLAALAAWAPRALAAPEAFVPVVHPLERVFAGAQSQPIGLPENIRVWMQAEQRLLSREVDQSRLSTSANRQNPRYAPEQAQVFDVKSYWVDAGAAHAFLGAGLPEGLRSVFVRQAGGRTQWRILVHPESEKFYADFLKDAVRGEDLRALATSSSRTLLVWLPGREREPFFAKLSLDAHIAAVTRTIPKSEVARSVGHNNILAADGEALPGGFKYLPEVFGLMPKGMDRGGMLIRTVPPEVLSGDKHLLPLFSLFAQPDEDVPPLLFGMAKRAGMAPEEFIKRKVLKPFIRQWLDAVVDRGISMEPHAQNVLIELGRDGLPTGSFVHRDLGGFNVDLRYRRRRGLPVPRQLPKVTSVKEDYLLAEHDVSLGSSLYDYFVGGVVYNLDRNLKKWREKGWMDASRSGGHVFEHYVIEELERAYARMTGLRPWTSAMTVRDNIVFAVKKARQKALGGSWLKRWRAERSSLLS